MRKAQILREQNGDVSSAFSNCRESQLSNFKNGIHKLTCVHAASCDAFDRVFYRPNIYNRGSDNWDCSLVFFIY